MNLTCPLCRIRRSYMDLVDHLQNVHGCDQNETRSLATEASRREREIRLQIEAGDRFKEYTLDTFPANEEAGENALATVRAWLTGELDDYNLFVHGPPGSGKSGLVYALGRAAINIGSSPQFINVRQFLAQMRSEIAEGTTPDISERISADLLILDDLGAERPTEWAVEQIATIVENFYVANDGCIVVTSNYKPSELIARLTTPADPVSGRRIVSRLMQDTTVINLDRPDQRVKRKLRAA